MFPYINNHKLMSTSRACFYLQINSKVNFICIKFYRLTHGHIWIQNLKLGFSLSKWQNTDKMFTATGPGTGFKLSHIYIYPCQHNSTAVDQHYHCWHHCQKWFWPWTYKCSDINSFFICPCCQHTVIMDIKNLFICPCCHTSWHFLQWHTSYQSTNQSFIACKNVHEVYTYIRHTHALFIILYS